jgi:hypothetical protein
MSLARFFDKIAPAVILPTFMLIVGSTVAAGFATIAGI